jgi:hypothetical protein
MPSTTEFENVDKVEKIVGYLDIEEAVKLWPMTTSVLSVRTLTQLNVASEMQKCYQYALIVSSLCLAYGRHQLWSSMPQDFIARIINDRIS